MSNLFGVKLDQCDGQELSKHNHNASNNSTELWLKQNDQHTWDDSAEGRRIHGEIIPIKNVIVDVILLLDVVEFPITCKTVRNNGLLL